MLSDLTNSQKLLADYMSELSEEAYTAYWMDGLELVLWKVVKNELDKYGRLTFTSKKREKLNQLSIEANGWIIFDEKKEETFVTFEEWNKIIKNR